MRIARLFRRRDERGATAVEYSLVAALVAAVVVLTVGVLGTETDDLYQCTGRTISSQVSQC